MSLFYTRPDWTFYPGVFPSPEEVRIEISSAPDCMRGLRLLFFSDVHLRRRVSDDALHSLIARLAAIRPDMILMGGDYAEGSDQCLRFFKAFKGVSAPLGCYGVAGNNDHPSAAILARIMADAGATLLKNEARRVEIPGGCIEIGGCDEHKHGSPDTRSLFSGSASYRILLSHYPARPDCSCDLMLSGHTHAGQCNVLGVTPYSIGFERKFRLLGVRGIQNDNMKLLIGNGIGVSRFPFRLCAQPQIYRIDFS